VLFLIALAALAPAACGSDGGTKTAAPAASPGTPAAVATGNRVVEIKMLAKAFDPKTVSVKAGETITFKVTNTDSAFHEFFIGDAAAQDKRDTEMAAMSKNPMNMPDKENTITVAAGQTEQLAWKFTDKGSVIYGDHNPGQYAAGMKGTVNVT